MASQVFTLLAAAVAAGAILYILLGFFVFENESPLAEINKALDYTEANEGEMLELELSLKKDFAMKAGLMDNETRSVRFECSSPEACDEGKIALNSRNLFMKTAMITSAYVRCKHKEFLNDCVVYIGNKPAQLDVEILSLRESVKKGETGHIMIQAGNTGSLEAIDSSYKIEFMLMSSDGIKENLPVKKEITGVLERIAPERTETVTEEFEINASGEYYVKVTVQGEDSGIAFAEKQLIITEGVSSDCEAAEAGRTYLDGAVCRTEFLCEGCETAYECAIRWREKGIDAQTGGKDKAYAEEPAVAGECN